VNRRASQNKAPGKVMMVETPRVPLQFSATVRFKHKFRFQCMTSSFSSPVTISRANLLSLLSMNTSGGTTNYRIITGIKLNRIEIFGTANVSGFSSSTVSVEWLSNLGPSTLTSDSSGSPAYPAHMVTTPPPQSLSSFWSLSGINETENLFTIVAPTLSIIDVWCDVVLMNGETPHTVPSSNSGTLGTLYLLALDSSGGNFPPVSYQTLV
jgi:hypothetical protein